MASCLTRRAAVAAALALSAAPGRPRAEAPWPDRPVTVIVPFPPGGSTDAVARLLTQGLATELGRNVVVDNRSGATGTIGFTQLARARPDGYTLGIAPGSTFAMAPHLYRLPYDAERAFAGGGLLATMPLMLIVPASSPYRSLADFLAAARRPEARIAYAHAGVGSSMHLAAELFLQVSGASVQAVSYRGTPPAIQGLMAGETAMAVMPASTVMPFLASGEVRALGVTGAARSALAPGVPTIAEQGFPGYEVMEEIALFAPAGTPEAVLRRVNAASAKVLADPTVRERLATLAVTPAVGAVEAWPPHFAAEYRKWGEVIRARNITLD